MEKYEFMARDKKNPSIHERLFRILFSSNHGIYPLSAQVDKKVNVHVYYEGGSQSRQIDKEEFFDLNPKSKIVNFYTTPKSSITERECGIFLQYLKKEGYKISGEELLTPRFRKSNEISLY